MASVDVLRVIAATVLSARGLLLVSKRVAPGVFYLPGGKPEPHEEPLTCLRRELREELRVEIVAATPLFDVRAPAALERTKMDMSVFHTRVRGTPTVGAEICELAWWPERVGVEVAPAVRDVVIPRLEALGQLSPADGVIVRRVSAGSTAALRAAVLRPGGGVDAVAKPDDDHPDTWFFAALASDARVLSTVNVRPATPPWSTDGASWWQLRGMSTAEDARGRGLARAVVDAALKHVTHAGGRVWCNARTSVLGFYQRVGFTIVGEERIDPVSGPHRWIVLTESDGGARSARRRSQAQ